MLQVRKFCPQCGNEVMIDPSKEKFFCPYCGHLITNVNVTSNYLKVDHPKKSFFTSIFYYIITACLSLLIGIFSFFDYGRVEFYDCVYYKTVVNFDYSGKYSPKFVELGESFESILSIAFFILLCLLFIFYIINMCLKNRKVQFVESICSMAICSIGIILFFIDLNYMATKLNGSFLGENYGSDFAFSKFVGPYLFIICSLLISILVLSTIKFIKLIKK